MRQPSWTLSLLALGLLTGCVGQPPPRELAPPADPPPVGDPVRQREVENNWQAACMSNEKQLAQALLIYRQDYDGTYPSEGTAWEEQLAPYAKSRDILTCPADPDGFPSYGLVPDLRGTQLPRGAQPNEQVAIYETDDGGGVVERHNGGANYGFADGHVRWFESHPVQETLRQLDPSRLPHYETVEIDGQSRVQIPGF